MKVEIIVDDNYLDLIAAKIQLSCEDGSEREAAKQAKQLCLTETVTLEPKDFDEEDGEQLQFAVAMMALAKTAQNLMEKNQNKE